MRSINDAIKPVVSLVPDQYAADTNGAGVDTEGFTSGQLVIVVGTIDTADGDEVYQVKLEESVDNVQFAPVDPPVDILVGSQVRTVAIEGLGTSRKRFLRAVVKASGTTPAIIASVTFNLGHAFNEPVN